MYVKHVMNTLTGKWAQQSYSAVNLEYVIIIVADILPVKF